MGGGDISILGCLKPHSSLVIKDEGLWLESNSFEVVDAAQAGQKHESR